MTMNEQKKPIATTKQLAAGGSFAAAIALAAAIIAPWEGKRNDPYLDIVRINTVCYGHTGSDIQKRRYSDAECKAILEKDIYKHAAPVFKCTPSLINRPYEAAAAISLAFNVGTGAYCRSTADRRFDAGDWKGGCQAIGRFNMAGGRVVKGLVNRRNAEIKICMKGAGA